LANATSLRGDREKNTTDRGRWEKKQGGREPTTGKKLHRKKKLPRRSGVKKGGASTEGDRCSFA